jgi:hypothetical protein|tara:strand:+ start:2643 stop:3056 length:414 start_codon:yes stop_codon:yes gene_type:complete
MMTARGAGNWVLPQPLDIKEEGEWVSLPKIARTIPFGYRLDEDNAKILRPIELELNLLHDAKKHLKMYPYREVSNWLSTQSGRYISHVGLMKRVKNERRRKDKAHSYRVWAAYAEEALATAKSLEEERLDATKKANA